MRRKLMCVVLCLLIVFGTFAFAVSAQRVDPKDVDWGLTLSAAEVTPTGMVIVIAQFGGNYQGTLEYSAVYHLETLSEKGWEWVPYSQDVAFPLEADAVLPNSVYRLQENWEMLYGKLEPGRYRYVMKFIEWGDERIDDKEAEFYVDFAITDSHKCLSKDQDLLCDRCYCMVEHPCVDEFGDAECDICGKLISDKNVYRIVGSAEWMGMWSPSSNEGIMRETESGVYQASFSNVPAGEYSFFISVNGEWDNGFGVHPDDCYEFELTKTADLDFTLDLRNGVALVSVSAPDPLPLKIPTSQTVYRVTGNADWLGSWKADNDLGIMTEVKTGVYRKKYKNVPAGCYELKITKNGKWDEAYGDNGQNYTFTLTEKSDITVDFYLKDDIAVIDVYGLAGWPDEDDEENPKSSDLTNLPAVFLLISVAAMVLLFRKREGKL